MPAETDRPSPEPDAVPELVAEPAAPGSLVSLLPDGGIVIRDQLPEHDRPSFITMDPPKHDQIKARDHAFMRLHRRVGLAGAAVSAGNTGALMSMAKLSLRTMPGIDRPALAALLPSLGKTDFVMLDLGANTECAARNLVEFGVMGAAYARIALGIERPRVSLLNIGTEDLKGTDAIRDAATTLRSSAHLQLSFMGFIEGDKLSRGETDVVVCDGFSGNIALKTMEGTARFVTDLLRRAFTSSIRSKFGFLISRPATELMRHHLDPNNHNGAVFLGLNGVVVKSHGSATDYGVANAIGVAAKLVAENITSRISDDLANVKDVAE